MRVSRPFGVIVMALVTCLVAAVAVMSSASPQTLAGSRSGLFIASEAGTVAFITGGVISIGLIIWAFTLRLKEQKYKGPREKALNRKSIWRMLLEQLLLPLYALGAVLFSYFLATDVFSKRRAGARSGASSMGARPTPLGAVLGHAHRSATPWAPVLIATAIVLAIGALGAYLWHVMERKEKRARAITRPAVGGTVASLIPKSLELHRDDPDSRRAVLVAFADMEQLLSSSGEARLSSELPRQYLARRLGAESALYRRALRLTELFEWARYSGHAVHPRQKDEAVALLEAMRAHLASP